MNKKEQRMYPKDHMCMSLKTFILILNFIIVLACTATLIFQGSQCFIRYFSADTKAILSVKPTGQATFLALTICPRYDAHTTLEPKCIIYGFLGLRKPTM